MKYAEAFVKGKCRDCEREEELCKECGECIKENCDVKESV